MLLRKIHIIGGPGSGKTFTARKLEAMLGIKACDLDQLFWDQSQSSFVRASAESRDKALAQVLSHESWVIEGVYYKWLADSFNDADIIIVLTPSIYLRQSRIFRRFLYRKFVLLDFRRETLSSFIELFWWSQKFDQDNLLRIRSFIKEHEHKIVFGKCYEEVQRAVVR